MKPILLACLLLAGCAGRKYQVCWTGDYTGDVYCGTPMRKHDARIALRYGVRHEPPYVVMKSDGVSGLHYRKEKPASPQYCFGLTKTEKDTLITLLKSSAYGADAPRKRVYLRVLEQLEKP